MRTAAEIVQLCSRLERLESQFVALLQGLRPPKVYTIEEFARQVGRTPFTVREWARLARIHAAKQRSGRGAYCRWVISHDELLRFQREGLLPLDPRYRHRPVAH